MTFDIRDNFPDVERALVQDQRQAAFAASLAINWTAKDVRTAEVRTMEQVFDRPTKYALNGLFINPSTKDKLVAEVFLKDDRATSNGGTPATRFIGPHIYGGERGAKRFEVMLQRIGVLPRGWYAVPGAGATIDSNGNMSRGQIVQILSYLQAFYLAGSSANSTPQTRAKLARGTRNKRGVEYFVSTVNSMPVGRGSWKNGEKRQHLPPGIYIKVGFTFGKAIKPVLLFVDKASYSIRFKFFEVGEQTARRVFPGHWEAAAARALKTAR